MCSKNISHLKGQIPTSVIFKQLLKDHSPLRANNRKYLLAATLISSGLPIAATFLAYSSLANTDKGDVNFKECAKFCFTLGCKLLPLVYWYSINFPAQPLAKALRNSLFITLAGKYLIEDTVHLL